MVGSGWYQFYLFLEAAITNCHKLRAKTMCVLDCCRCQESEIMRWSGQCFLQGLSGDFVLASSLPWLLVFLGLKLLKLNVFLYLHFLSPLDLLVSMPLVSIHATGVKAFLKGLFLAKSLTKCPLYFVCLFVCMLVFFFFSNKIAAVVSRDENADSIILGSSIHGTTLPSSSSHVYPSQ